MTSTTDELTRRRLGTDERHVWLLGMGVRQLVFATPFVILMLLEVYSLGSLGILTGFITIAIGAAFVYGSRNGEHFVDSIPHRIGHAWANLTGDNVWSNPSATAGIVQNLDSGKAHVVPVKLPRMIGNLSALAHRTRTGELIGIAVDGGSTYTGTISLQCGDFITLPFLEQDTLLSKWGQILARRATEGSPISRVAWVVRTIAENPEAHAQYLRDAARPDFFTDDKTLGYRRAMSIGDDVPEFEITVNITIDTRKAGRKIRQSGGGRLGACRVLEAELMAIGRELSQQLKVRANWVLFERFIDDMRLVYEPYERPNVLGLDGNGSPRSIQDILPASLHNEAHFVATGRSYHRVYHIRSFPNQDLPPDYAYDFLADRLQPKAIVMVIEPVPNTKANRQLMVTANNDDADIMAREGSGRRVSAFSRNQADQNDAREEELVEGHRMVRFSMYATTGGRTHDELEDNCLELEGLFADSSMDIKPMTDQHAGALSFFLPAGRGLKPRNAFGMS